MSFEVRFFRFRNTDLDDIFGMTHEDYKHIGLNGLKLARETFGDSIEFSDIRPSVYNLANRLVGHEYYQPDKIKDTIKVTITPEFAELSGLFKNRNSVGININGDIGLYFNYICSELQNNMYKFEITPVVRTDYLLFDWKEAGFPTMWTVGKLSISERVYHYLNKLKLMPKVDERIRLELSERDLENK